jgi:hypothetical protein
LEWDLVDILYKVYSETASSPLQLTGICYKNRTFVPSPLFPEIKQVTFCLTHINLPYLSHESVQRVQRYKQD